MSPILWKHDDDPPAEGFAGAVEWALGFVVLVLWIGLILWLSMIST